MAQTTFKNLVQPRDIIAILLLGSAVYLKCHGLNGQMDVVIAALVGYYLSKRVYEEKNK